MTRIRIAAAVVLLACLVAAGVSMRAAERATESPVEAFNRSLALEAEGKLDEALREVEGTMPAHADNYLINLRLGWLYYSTRNFPSSKRYYQEALKLSGMKSIEAMLGLTLPMAATEDWAEVESLYERILQYDPAHYTANLRLGQIYMNRAEYALAEPHLQTARTHYPSEYEANLSSAWNSYYLGKRQDAQEFFERTLMLSPGDTSAQSGLSLVR